MKTSAISLIGLVLCGLAGCAAPVFTPFVPERTTIRNYEIGATRSVPVGEQIFEVQNATIAPAYEVIADYEPPQRDTWNGGYNYAPLKRGMKFAVTGTRGDGLVQISSPDYVVDLNSTYLDPSGRPSGAVRIPIHPWGVVEGRPSIAGKDWTTDTLFKKSDEGVVTGGLFKAEMIYAGLIGTTVKAVYREFVNDYARPAFTTELQYNLDESKTIAYRSIKIEVLKATNSSLEYRVVSDDGLAWVK